MRVLPSSGDEHGPARDREGAQGTRRRRADAAPPRFSFPWARRDDRHSLPGRTRPDDDDKSRTWWPDRWRRRAALSPSAARSPVPVFYLEDNEGH